MAFRIILYRLNSLQLWESTGKDDTLATSGISSLSHDLHVMSQMSQISSNRLISKCCCCNTAVVTEHTEHVQM